MSTVKTYTSNVHNILYMSQLGVKVDAPSCVL